MTTYSNYASVPAHQGARIIQSVALAALLIFLFSIRFASAADLPPPIAAPPADAVLAAQALAAHIQGQDTPAVTFPGGSKATMGKTPAGFQLARTDIFRYADQPKNPEGRIVAGRLIHHDQGGREAATLFFMEYTAGGSGLVVSKLEAADYYTGTPDSRLYIVPAEVVSAQSKAVFSSYNRLLAFVVANAIPPDEGAFPDEARNYVAFAFLTERISPSAIFEAKVSNSDAGKGGYKYSSRYLDFDDWRVALIPGKFNLKHINPLYFKLVVSEGEEVGFFSRGSELVGLYSSWNRKK